MNFSIKKKEVTSMNSFWVGKKQDVELIEIVRDMK